MEEDMNYELIKELLIQLNFGDDFVPNEEYKVKSKLITKINEESLSEKMNRTWIEYLGNSVDIQELQENFKNRYLHWNKQQNEFDNIKTEDKMISFIETYFQRRYSAGYKLGDISKKEIQDLIDHKRPKISKEFTGMIYDICNFLIFSNDHLHVTLHVNLESFREESFLLTSIFGFWFEEPENPFELHMNDINNNYKNFVLARNCMNKLEINNYRNAHLFDFDKYNTQYHQNKEFLNYWVLNYPHMFMTYVKQILNANPMTLFEEIIEDIKSLQKNDLLIDNKIQSPESWFENLNQELQFFYKRGKELFLKVSHLFDDKTQNAIENIEDEEKSGRKPKLEVQDFLFLFNKAMDIDIENGISTTEAGFRTFNQLFKDFLDKTTRDTKYDYIEPVSKGTFYNLMNQYKSELEMLLEKNSEKGKAGGDAYRITKPENLRQSETVFSGEILSDEALKIKEIIHEGLISYKNNDHENIISLFSNLIENQGKELKNSEEDFYGVLYYSGKSHMKLNDFKSALSCFKEIYDSDQNKIDVGFKLVECYYKLEEYETAKDLILSLHENLLNLIRPYNSLYRKEIIFDDYFRHMDVSPETLHPNVFTRDLFSKNLIMLNRTIIYHDYFSIQPRLERKWEEYERKMEEYKEIKFLLNRNIQIYSKLTKLRFSIENYLMEIYRKLIFYSVLIQKDEIDSIRLVKEILNLLKRKIREKDINRSSTTDFLVYLIHFSKISFPDDQNIIEKLIKESFPDLDDNIDGYKYIYPINTRFIRMNFFLSATAMKSGNFQWASEELKKEAKNPALILEFIIIEFTSLLKIKIEEILDKFQQNFEDKGIWRIKSNYNLYNLWKYDIRLGGRGGIEHITKRVQNYIKYSENNDLIEYSMKLKQQFKQFKTKLTEIQDLRSKGRNKALQLIFKREYKKFKKKDVIEEIDLSQKPKNFHYDSILEMKIFNKIFFEFERSPTEKIIQIKLFDPKILVDVFEDIREKLRLPHIVKLDKSLNQVSVHFKKQYDFQFQYSDFNRKLDDFVYDVILDSFETGDDEIYFKYNLNDLERFKTYFEKQFLIDFENSYFTFEIKDYPEQSYYCIKIIKKNLS